jgi:hypothetical protein
MKYVFFVAPWIIVLWLLAILAFTVTAEDIREGIKQRGVAYIYSKYPQEEVIICK